MACCVYCRSSKVFTLDSLTHLGYSQYRCELCEKLFDSRTRTTFFHLKYPSDVVLFAVYYYLTNQISYEETISVFNERGIVFSLEEIQKWVKDYSIIFSSDIYRKKETIDKKHCSIDEEKISLKGKIIYLYRLILSGSRLLDVCFSTSENKEEAKQLFYSREKAEACFWRRKHNPDKREAVIGSLLELSGKQGDEFVDVRLYGGAKFIFPIHARLQYLLKGCFSKLKAFLLKISFRLT